MKNDNLNTEDTYLAKWLANEISDTDLQNLVSKQAFAEYVTLKKGLDLFEKLTPNKNAFQQIKNRTENQPKIKKLYTKWAISIAAMLLLFLGLNTFLKGNAVINKTNFGQQKTITLLDGSEVILQAKTAISYNKKTWKNKRELYLNGEAFFKVKKGSNFTVHTKNGIVEVLGTQFNVNSNKDYFEVVCYEGKVRVTNTMQKFILTPSQAVRKINGNAVENFTTKKATPSWISGESTFKSVPLKYVLLALEKQFNVTFDASKINTNSLFTGSFPQKDKNIAFATVFKAMQINYTQTKNKIILIKTKK